MTFLCLETSLQCREVIDTLASSHSAENWCLETVLPLPFLCIVDLANHGGPCNVVTHPLKSDRDVKITYSLHCMQLEYPRPLPGNIHTMNSQLISSVRSHSVAVRSDSANHPNIQSALVGPALLEGSSWRKKNKKIPQELQVNLSQKQHTIQQCQLALDDAPCKASMKK